MGREGNNGTIINRVRIILSVCNDMTCHLFNSATCMRTRAYIRFITAIVACPEMSITLMFCRARATRDYNKKNMICPRSPLK